jgi:hypothetical protein
MILLQDTVEILDLADLDQDFSLRSHLVDRCLVIAALIRCNRVRDLVVPRCLIEKAPTR